jgi:N-acetylglucosaminyl-diphospho-decaprenol L-rhamnosyltransferase
MLGHSVEPREVDLMPNDRHPADIVVVTWRGRATLPRCLASVRSVMGLAPHVIVVDNASEDGTASWLAAQAGVDKVVTSPRNLGFAGGANAGIRSGSAPYVGLLNDDAEVEPAWLDTLVAVLEAPGNERVAAVTSRVLLSGSHLVNSTGNLVSPQGRGRDRDWLVPREQHRTAGEVFGFCGAATLLRRAALDEVGLFEEDLFLYYEDTDLSWRLRAAGWTILYEPGAVASHRHASSSHEGSPQFTLWNERNSLIVFTRHAPAHLVLSVHLRRAVGLLVHTARRPRSAVTAARWRAMYEHARRLRRTLAERRSIWRSARVTRRQVARLLNDPADDYPVVADA